GDVVRNLGRRAIEPSARGGGGHGPGADSEQITRAVLLARFAPVSTHSVPFCTGANENPAVAPGRHMVPTGGRSRGNTMMRREVGEQSFPMWLIGDSNPDEWENDLETPFDPRHSARHNIWTAVIDVVQDRLFRSR